MQTYSITVWGERVPTDTARDLVATLIADGRPESVKFADRLARCLDREVQMMALETSERDTLLSVLEDPPDELAALRGKLLRDFEWRQREGSANNETGSAVQPK